MARVKKERHEETLHMSEISDQVTEAEEAGYTAGPSAVTKADVIARVSRLAAFCDTHVRYDGVTIVRGTADDFANYYDTVVNTLSDIVTLAPPSVNKTEARTMVDLLIKRKDLTVSLVGVTASNVNGSVFRMELDKWLVKPYLKVASAVGPLIYNAIKVEVDKLKANTLSSGVTVKYRYAATKPMATSQMDVFKLSNALLGMMANGLPTPP